MHLSRAHRHHTDESSARITSGGQCEGNNASRKVRLSSRPLGWHALNFELHETAPACKALPAGASSHLVVVTLTGGRLARRSGSECIERELRPGAVAVYPAGVPIQWRWMTPLSYSILMLEPEFLDNVAAGIYGAKPGAFQLMPTERDHDASIASLAGALTEEVMRAEHSQLYVESLANLLALHLLRNYARWERDASPTLTEPANAAKAPPVVQRAIRYMHQNHARSIGLHDIAKATSVSPFHLSRVFKQSLGVPPHQYLIRLRVDNAVSLIRASAGKQSLAEVALAVGFADQSHLTRHVKRVLGVTPRQLLGPAATAAPATLPDM